MRGESMKLFVDGIHVGDITNITVNAHNTHSVGFSMDTVTIVTIVTKTDTEKVTIAEAELAKLNRIRAIKCYRDRVGCGLLDAKHAIDAAVPRSEYGEEYPKTWR